MWSRILELQDSNYDSPNLLTTVECTEKFIDHISTPVLSVYIKDKHQILSCSNPSTWQSESCSQTVNWMMSCPCSVPSLQWFSNVLKKKPCKEYFVDSCPKPNFHSFLVPPSASHSSVISSFFPCSTAFQVSSTITKALL